MEVKYYDGLVILDRPLQIYGSEVYGVYINLEEEKSLNQRSVSNLQISSYCNYLLAVSQLLKAGGEISEDGRKWTFENDKLSITFNQGMKIFLSVLLDGMIKFKVVRIDPVEIEDGLVIDAEVIERYSNNETIEIGGKECAEQ